MATKARSTRSAGKAKATTKRPAPAKKPRRARSAKAPAEAPVAPAVTAPTPTPAAPTPTPAAPPRRRARARRPAAPQPTPPPAPESAPQAAPPAADEPLAPPPAAAALAPALEPPPPLEVPPAPALEPPPPLEVPPAAPEAAPPRGPRRAVFVDVENTSSEAALSRVLDELQLELADGVTEITAIGNWRVASPILARALAHRGAALVHSAPAARVRDWSDLWIAVHAGMWLGRARPGDVLEIVSHDRAFDAVADAAARLGVTFRRLTYRGAGAAPARDEEEAADGGRGRRRSRRGRGGRGAGTPRAAAPARPAPPPSRAPSPPSRAPAPPPSRAPSPPSRAPAPPAPAAPPAAAPPETDLHGASEAEIEQTIARLAGTDPTGTITLDALTAALKAAGFHRPPGSPRLVTRLRHMKRIEVLPNSRVRLRGAAPGGGADPGASG